MMVGYVNFEPEVMCFMVNTSIDIDECLAGSIGDTTCEVCENTMGSYTCGCNPGRVLMSDGVSCRGMLTSIPVPHILETMSSILGVI